MLRVATANIDKYIILRVGRYTHVTNSSVNQMENDVALSLKSTIQGHMRRTESV